MMGGVSCPIRAPRPHSVPMTFFRILFAVDALAALVALVFFVWGLADGSVSDFNIGAWLLLLGGIGAILGGGWWLHGQGFRRQAYGVLSILAFPSVGFALILFAALIFQPRWN